MIYHGYVCEKTNKQKTRKKTDVLYNLEGKQYI